MNGYLVFFPVGFPCTLRALQASALDRLAEAVSVMLNPLLLPPVLFGIISVYAGAAAGHVLLVSSVGVLFFALVPASYVYWELQRGRVASLNIRDRTRRERPLLVTIACYLTGAALMSALSVPGQGLLGWLMACYGFNTGLTLLVTRYWKISIHALAIAAIPSVLFFLAYGLGRSTPFPALWLLFGFSTACIPLVGWARVRLHHHTPQQVIAGALGGLILPVLELWLLQAAGLMGFP